jgi:putative oxidoreductase
VIVVTENPTPQPDRPAEGSGQDATTAFAAQGQPSPPSSGGVRGDGVRGDGDGVPYYQAPAHPGQRQDVAAPRTVSPPLVSEPADDEGHVAQAPRGTTDLGLLLLRVGLGVILLAHGSQNLFALFHGPGINGFEDLLTRAGYAHAHLLAYLGSIAEVGAGAFLVLGLLTPLAGAAALGTTINAWFVADQAAPGFRFFVSAQGQELEMLLVLLAAVVVLLGPGRFSLDRRRGWATRPLLSSWLGLVLGVAAGLLVWFLLNGATPFA